MFEFCEGIENILQILQSVLTKYLFKGSDRQCMAVELRM